MFDSTAMLGLFRPFRLLVDDRGARSFWLSRGAELLADWVCVVALFVSVFRLTSEISVVAVFMLLRVLPRAIVIAAGQSLAARIEARGLVWLSLPRVPLIASLALIDSRSDLWWAGAVVLGYGLLTAVTNEARALLLPRLVTRPRLTGVIALNASIERITFVAGPLLAALILWDWSAGAAFVVGAALLSLASVLLGVRGPIVEGQRPFVASPVPDAAATWRAIRHQPTLLLLTGGLSAGAALAICLKVVLVELATGPLDRSEAMLGLLLALVGVGTLLGPLSVPRLLGHLPVALIVTGTVMGTAAGIALVSVVTRLEIVALVLVTIGVVSITNDMVTATVTRRLAPEDDLPNTARLMVVAVGVGQIVATVAVTLLASVWSLTTVMLTVSAGSALLMAILFLMADGQSIAARRLAAR